MENIEERNQVTTAAAAAAKTITITTISYQKKREKNVHIRRNRERKNAAANERRNWEDNFLRLQIKNETKTQLKMTHRTSNNRSNNKQTNNCNKLLQFECNNFEFHRNGACAFYGCSSRMFICRISNGCIAWAAIQCKCTCTTADKTRCEKNLVKAKWRWLTIKTTDASRFSHLSSASQRWSNMRMRKCLPMR